MFGCLILFGEKTGTTMRLSGFKALLVPLIWFFYFPVTESLFGRTLSKRFFDLYVIDNVGRPPTIIQAFLRRLLDPFEIATMGVFGVLTINFSKRNQRIGDLIADTRVITSHAVCRFCGEELELSPKEVAREIFICPICNQTN
jgi:uncharacterized RDD family membrane protein YckC